MSSDPRQWGVASLTLQRPEHVYFAGEIRPWDEAVLHVSTEAVTRGLNVFEGLKGYWQQEGERFGFRSLRRHYERMTRSARLLHIPIDFSYEKFVDACLSLARVELITEKDLYIRATLFVVEGHKGEGTRADLVLTAYKQEKDPPAPVDVGTSTWRRSPDVSMPIRVKTSANYHIARLARIEGRSRGYEDMVLLNQSGRVAEGIGACLLMVRDGKVVTPPPSEGAVESITLDILTQLGLELGISVDMRPVERSELYICDELGLTGTLTEITPIRSIDDMGLPEERPVLSALQQRYREAATGVDPHPVVDLTFT